MRFSLIKIQAAVRNSLLVSAPIPRPGMSLGGKFVSASTRRYRRTRRSMTLLKNLLSFRLNRTFVDMGKRGGLEAALESVDVTMRFPSRVGCFYPLVVFGVR